MKDLPTIIKNSITVVGLKKYLVWEKSGYGHVVFRFPNGYGASVIRNPMSYGVDKGLFELAVLEWQGEDYHLTYTTPITEDVIGYLTGEEVEKYLLRIKQLANLLPLDKKPELE